MMNPKERIANTKYSSFIFLNMVQKPCSPLLNIMMKKKERNEIFILTMKIVLILLNETNITIS